ncbi:MAG: hypothetical protein ACRD3Q_21750, partial [Terriglobales bacterium]
MYELVNHDCVTRRGGSSGQPARMPAELPAGSQRYGGVQRDSREKTQGPSAAVAERPRLGMTKVESSVAGETPALRPGTQQELQNYDARTADSLKQSPTMDIHPTIIQGGMGAGVSNWRLAHAVSTSGQLGVVSGIALDQILIRRLQDGDPGGHMRRGLDHFPDPTLAGRIWREYYIEGGKPKNEPYRSVPMHSKQDARRLVELCIVGNFVEVYLAGEGHRNPVGVNYLEKIQIPLLPSIYGAMLAGVRYVLMGAGIPLKIPGVLDALAEHRCATYPLTVAGAGPGDDTIVRFDPRDFLRADLPPLVRPYFLAIVSSNTLATTMVKKANGRVDGFVIEGDTAGGHNAPPRGVLRLDSNGEPLYGERDRVDLEQLRELDRPFWLAGGYGSAQKLRHALA